MLTTHRPVLALTAADVMKGPVEVVPETMLLREAARRLSRAQVSGAPVVDAGGRCVGVLSSGDFVRWAEGQPEPSAPLPRTCPYWVREQLPDGKLGHRCTLPSGTCPLQVERMGRGGESFRACLLPHCVLVDWQQVEPEEMPADEVSRYMTRDPVTVPAGTPVTELARMMVDAHIHRVIVVDPAGKPVGIVSSTDLLAILASLKPQAPGT